MGAFNGLDALTTGLDLDLACCKRCPIHRFCFQKGDFGELYEKDPTLQQEFPNCPELRTAFFDLMVLGDQGQQMYERMVRETRVTTPACPS